MEKYKIYGYQFINVYYTTLLSGIGFILLYLYYLYKGIYFETSFLLFQLVSHILPIVILLMNYKRKLKYAFETFIIVTILYILYLIYTDKNINDIYFHKEKIIKSWDKLESNCKEKNEIFYCDIYKNLNKIRNTLLSALKIS